ncbi:hypothetical protein Tco_0980895 [Tanacetum coccineum]
MVLLEETPSSKLKRYHKIGLNTQWCSGTGAGKIELEKSGGVDLGFVVLAGRKIVIISKQGSSHVRSIDGALFKHIRAAHSGKNGKKHKLNGRTREFGTLHRRSDLVEISDVHLDLLRDALSAIFGLSELKAWDAKDALGYILDCTLKDLASDEELEELMKDQLLPADASPIALSSGYISDSDPEEDDEEDPEEDPADYPADGGDNDDNESSDDDNDDDDVRGGGAPSSGRPFCYTHTFCYTHR